MPRAILGNRGITHWSIRKRKQCNLSKLTIGERERTNVIHRTSAAQLPTRPVPIIGFRCTSFRDRRKSDV